MKYRTPILILLILISGMSYYLLTSEISTEKIKIIRVIDGDTVELEGKIKARLLGINAPEKTMPDYLNAKNFLSKLVENKTAIIQKNKVDKYGRFLVHIFTNEHINKKIIENGLAHLYYYEHDEYYNDLEKAQEEAIKKKIGIWKYSEKSSCIKLIKFKHTEPEQIILENNCEQIQIIIKDEATHIYKETLTNGKNTFNFSHIFNDDGDTLFIWDENGKLILLNSYP